MAHKRGFLSLTKLVREFHTHIVLQCFCIYINSLRHFELLLHLGPPLPILINSVKAGQFKCVVVRHNFPVILIVSRVGENISIQFESETDL